MHIDTGFKFREMLTFRDAMEAAWARSCWCGVTSRRSRAGTNPIALDTSAAAALLKTQALLDGLRHYTSTRRLVGRGATRRNRGPPRSAFIPSANTQGQWDPKIRGRNFVEPYNARILPAKQFACFRFELDGDGCVAVHPRRKHSVVDLYFAKSGRCTCVLWARVQEALLPIEQLL